mgnify:CR=1 FL=1
MKRIVMIVIVVLMAFGVLVGCDDLSKPDTQEAGTAEQESVMERARRAYPTPQVDEFLTRRNVVKWMERMDQPGKIFYIYVMSDVGTITHYFVAEYRPVSVATYLTPTQRVIDRYEGDVVVNSPALDGTYYGSGGASDQYFFFDAETDALIELKGMNYIVSDQPFNVDAPQLTIQTSE